MEPRLTCSDFTFPLLSHEHALDLISLLEISAVDIGIFGGRSHIRPEHVFTDVQASARDLVLKTRDRGLDISDIYFIPGPDFHELAPNHPNESERRKAMNLFQRILEFTARCNATHMSSLPGVTWEGEPEEDALRRASDELAWRVEKARQLGITFSVEPHIGSLVPTPGQVKRLVEMTPELTLTLDYTHFTCQGISDAEIEPLIPYASHFHVRGGAPTRVQTSFKNNRIDYERVIRILEQNGYAGYFCLEYVWIEWQGCNDVDTLSETILFRDFLRSAVAQKTHHASK